MVLVLTWAAGGVDAISYMGLGHVFTANMTGNAVLLGLSLGQGQGFAALRSIIALAGFVLGVATGAIILERSPTRGDWPRAVTRAVAWEGGILGLFAIMWNLPGATESGEKLYALIALSALAMGVQSAAVRHLNVPGIATTYITGTLTSMIAGFVGWLHGGRVSESRAGLTSSAERKRGARLQAAVLIIYVLAAVASAVLQMRRSWLVTLSPLIAVALVVISASLRHRYDSHG
jgi:uncharacterized membrane protein YoaK (UPF0700 family)